MTTDGKRKGKGKARDEEETAPSAPSNGPPDTSSPGQRIANSMTGLLRDTVGLNGADPSHVQSMLQQMNNDKGSTVPSRSSAYYEIARARPSTGGSSSHEHNQESFRSVAPNSAADDLVEDFLSGETGALSEPGLPQHRSSSAHPGPDIVSEFLQEKIDLPTHPTDGQEVVSLLSDPAFSPYDDPTTVPSLDPEPDASTLFPPTPDTQGPDLPPPPAHRTPDFADPLNLFRNFPTAQPNPTMLSRLEGTAAAARTTLPGEEGGGGGTDWEALTARYMIEVWGPEADSVKAGETRREIEERMQEETPPEKVLERLMMVWGHLDNQK